MQNKLQQMKVSTHDMKKILDEIFGSQIGSVYYEGLIDAESVDSFDEYLSKLKVIWNKRSNDLGNTFHEGFVREKATVFITSAIRPVREAAGLGMPPIQFTTNDSETVNFVWKSNVGYKKNKLPRFIEKMQSLINEQQEELERTVYGHGKWKSIWN